MGRSFIEEDITLMHFQARSFFDILPKAALGKGGNCQAGVICHLLLSRLHIELLSAFFAARPFVACYIVSTMAFLI
jgi:hypothetical protein